jgi:hypothetical protein
MGDRKGGNMDNVLSMRAVKAADGRVLGHVVKTDSGSFFTQRKHVQRGAAYSLGLNRRYNDSIDRMMRDNRSVCG